MGDDFDFLLTSWVNFKNVASHRTIKPIKWELQLLNEESGTYPKYYHYLIKGILVSEGWILTFSYSGCSMV